MAVSNARWLRFGLSLFLGAATAILTPTSCRAAHADLFAGFTDDVGQPVAVLAAEKDYRLVVLGYTHCPDVCPLTLVALHRALNALGSRAKAIEPAFVTVDPGRDTVAVLHEHVRAFDPRIRAFRGDEPQLQRVCKALSLHYWREAPPPGTDAGGYTMTHSVILVLLRRDGSEAARIRFDEDPEVLAHSIVRAVHKAGVPSP